MASGAVRTAGVLARSGFDMSKGFGNFRHMFIVSSAAPATGAVRSIGAPNSDSARPMVIQPRRVGTCRPLPTGAVWQSDGYKFPMIF